MNDLDPDYEMHLAWACRPCEVGGTDVDRGEPITCWNCGESVFITARMPKKKRDVP